MKGYMPFPNAELEIPIEYKDAIDAFTRTRPTGGDRPDPEDAPFPRQVDMWLLAVCFGAVAGQRQKLATNQSHKFNTASVFESDPSRVEMLELLAIAVEKDPYVIKDPRRVIDVANELAAGGLPLVVEMLQARGGTAAIDCLSDLIQAKLAEILPAPSETRG